MTKKMGYRLACVLCMCLFSCNVSFAANALYPGEKLLVINHVQTVAKFIKGDASKPLVIFVPGDSQMARIAYGFPGGNEKDFLSYWLNQKGYSFLGLSYPTDNPAFSQVYPAFTVQEWGKQIASTASQYVKENKLSNHIIIVGWSMGGSIEEAATAASKQQGLIVDVFIGLSAVPPIPYVMQSGAFDTNKILPNKLADRKMLYPWFIKLLDQQNQFNGHVIIPEDIYVKQFLGNIPTALAAEGYHFQNGVFVRNVAKTIDEDGAFDFANTPWIALIIDDSPWIAKIALIDPASWNFLRAEMIYQHYLKDVDLTALPQDQWQRLTKLIHDLPFELTQTVRGNHFFFVGEKGAHDTADAIESLTSKVNELEHMITELTSAPEKPRGSN